jgi:eukaryotic-like serine/threonine-protein kinase
MMTAGPMLGATIGSYVVRKEIGAGGMGTVYLVEHTMLGRKAALKVLRSDMSANQEMVARFFNEARAASAIKSPGIVEIYDFGYHVDGSAYIVMELLDGEPLALRIRRLRCMPVPQALTIGRQIASALAPAHRAGIVHRDLKPDNIYLVPDGEAASGERVKLLDFGIAKLSNDGLGGDVNLTSTKMVMGSPQYMSPEQCRGSGQVDARADLYALGCILYELIAGRPPFAGDGFGELMGAHLHVQPVALSVYAPAVPPDVEAMVLRLLAKSPEERPQNADEVAAALAALAARHHAMGGAEPQGLLPRPPPSTVSHSRVTPFPLPVSTGARSHASSPPVSPTTLRQSSRAVAGLPPRQGGRGLAIGTGIAAVLSTLIAIGVIVNYQRSDTATDPQATEIPPIPEPVPTLDAGAATTAKVDDAGMLSLDAAVAGASDAAVGAGDAAVAGASDAAVAVASADAATSDAGAATSSNQIEGIDLDEKTPPATEKPEVAGQAKKDAPAGSKKKRRNADDFALPASLPASLPDHAKSAGVATVLAQIRACVAKTGIKGSVNASIKVLASGRVRLASIKSASDPRLAACVSSKLVHARFAATLYGDDFAFPFSFE